MARGPGSGPGNPGTRVQGAGSRGPKLSPDKTAVDRRSPAYLHIFIYELSQTVRVGQGGRSEESPKTVTCRGKGGGARTNDATEKNDEHPDKRKQESRVRRA